MDVPREAGGWMCAGEPSSHILIQRNTEAHQHAYMRSGTACRWFVGVFICETIGFGQNGLGRVPMSEPCQSVVRVRAGGDVSKGGGDVC